MKKEFQELNKFSITKFTNLLRKHNLLHNNNKIVPNPSIRIEKERIFFFEQLDSTNFFLSKLPSKEKKYLSIALTDHQTCGKGRGNNSWLSVPRSSILLSILLPGDFEKIENWKFLSQLLALALIETIQESYNIKLYFKWPNDIYYYNETNFEYKKISGILSQSSISNLIRTPRCTESLNKSLKNEKDNLLNYIIIGIGINVFKVPDLNTGKYSPISLNKICDSNLELEREKISVLLLKKFFYFHEQSYLSAKKNMFISKLNDLNILSNKFVKVYLPPRHSPKVKKAKFSKINLDGSVSLELPNKENYIIYDSYNIQII